MMHWKTLQTPIGAFALGVCLTTVVSPLKAIVPGFSQSDEVKGPEKKQNKQIFEYSDNEGVSINRKNFPITSEALSMLQLYLDEKSGGSKKASDKVTDKLRRMPAIRETTIKFLKEGYKIWLVGAKTEAEKKILIEKLEKKQFHPTEEPNIRAGLAKLSSQQMTELSRSIKDSNREYPLLTKITAMKLIDILTLYPGQKLDTLLLGNKDIDQLFMSYFIPPEFREFFHYDKNKDTKTENNCMIEAFKFFVREQASDIIQHISDEDGFQKQFLEKLENWPKTQTPQLKTRIDLKEQEKSLKIISEIKLTDGDRIALKNAETFYTTEATKRGLELGVVVVGFNFFVNATSDAELEKMKEYIKSTGYEGKLTSKTKEFINKRNPTFKDLKDLFPIVKKILDEEGIDINEALKKRGLDCIIKQLS